MAIQPQEQLDTVDIYMCALSAQTTHKTNSSPAGSRVWMKYGGGTLFKASCLVCQRVKMRFRAACSTEGIVSREEGNGNEAVEEQGEVSSSLVMDRLETVLTGLFIHMKWDRDLSERGRGKGRVRRPEGGLCRVGLWWERG